jgi:hypothetical protein
MGAFEGNESSGGEQSSLWDRTIGGAADASTGVSILNGLAGAHEGLPNVFAPFSIVNGIKEMATGDTVEKIHGGVETAEGAISMLEMAGVEIPVAGPLLASLGAGLGIGHFLDEKLHISDGIAKIDGKSQDRWNERMLGTHFVDDPSKRGAQHLGELPQSPEEVAHNAQLKMRMLAKGLIFDPTVGNYVPLGGPHDHYAA